MPNLYERQNLDPHDGLIASTWPPADVFHITLRKASGTAVTLKRGTLLDLSTGSNGNDKYVIHGTQAAAGETLTPNAILAEDAEVGTSADVIAPAYRTGHFAENKLVVATGATISAADKEALRDVGILLSDAFEIS